MKYQYKCNNCKHDWEAEQSMKDDPLTQCPECKKETAERIITGGLGFQLKGSGWFKSGGY